MTAASVASGNEAGLAKIAEGRRLIDEGLALLGAPLTHVVETRVMAREPDACHNASMTGEPLLLDVPEAARLMGISEAAFRTRLNRGQISGVVRTGRKVEIHRGRLLAGLTKTKPSRAA